MDTTPLVQALNQLFAAYPILKTICDALCVIVPLSALTAFAGLDFMSAVSKILSIVRNRSTFDKCARQLAFLCVVLGWILLVGSRVWLYLDHPAKDPNTVEYYIIEISWILLSIGVLLASVYFTLWKVLKNLPVLHTTIGMTSAVQCTISTVAILAAIRVINAIHASNSPNLSIPDIFPATWNSPVWSACAYTIPLFFAIPAAWAAVWLPTRRKKDDFGRDYYNTMVAWCARWARNAWLLLWLLLLISCALQLWIDYEYNAFNEQNAIVEGLRILLWLIPLLLWTIVAKSALALRHKGGLWLALALASCFMLPYFFEITGV